jgi:hypothetical protein
LVLVFSPVLSPASRRSLWRPFIGLSQDPLLSNAGVDPQIAARQAAKRGVRVFTIGYGTTNPAPLVCSSSQLGGGFGGGVGGVGGFGGGFPGGFGGRNPLVADYGALRQIAGTTGGKFYRAQSADQLKAALGSLSGTFTIIREHRDIADWFAGLGGLLVAIALALSLWWNRTRLPPRRRGSPSPLARIPVPARDHEDLAAKNGSGARLTLRQTKTLRRKSDIWGRIP